MDINLLLNQTRMTPPDLAERLGKSADTIYRWMRGDSSPSRAERIVMEDLLQKYLAVPFPSYKNAEFHFIDLFAGIGGFRKAFESIGGECVFTSEWDRFAQKTYQQNFPISHMFAGDIRQVPVEDIPPHDILLAGFPCQPFSIAGVTKKNALGRKHGFLDEAQGTLFFDIARILDHHRPRMFLLENVKNLRSHDRGRTFDVIYRTLAEDLGYHVQFRIIDAQHWVPQHRERIFILGSVDQIPFDLNEMPLPDKISAPRLSAILHPEDGTEAAEEPYTQGDLAVVNPKYTLTPRLWQYLQDYAIKHQAKGNGFGFGLVGPNDTSRTISARYYKDGSEILVRQPDNRPRRLTPRECARLMGYDENSGTESGWVIPVSDVQAYKQFGNGVAVPVVKHIAKYIKPFLVDRNSTPTPTRELDKATNIS